MSALNSVSELERRRTARPRSPAALSAVCLALSLCLHVIGALVLSMLPYSAASITPPSTSVDSGAHSVRVTIVPTPRAVPPNPHILTSAVIPTPDTPATPPITHALPVPPTPIAVIPTTAPGSVLLTESAAKIEFARAPAPVLTASAPEPRPEALARLHLALPSDRAEPQPAAPSTPSREDDAGAWSHAEIVGGISPRYPSLSRRYGEQGLVVLEVHVLPSGSVDKIHVLHDPGRRRLVEASIEAVRSATFTPATRHGKPVSSWLRVPIRFVMK